ncbi:hypothetical protein GOODEAATRI_012292 [Goodea atripinnis]|uniref:Uncharacterized protein n=1 Tax=Goodea atripinnis TaxID=208336 RepID=A0ABV0N0R2_9TELE
MGPPTEPPPFCSSPLTRSLVPILSVCRYLSLCFPALLSSIGSLLFVCVFYLFFTFSFLKMQLYLSSLAPAREPLSGGQESTSIHRCTVFVEQRGLIMQEEREMAGVCGAGKEAFDELSLKVHQSTHIFKLPNGSCLPSD